MIQDCRNGGGWYVRSFSPLTAGRCCDPLIAPALRRQVPRIPTISYGISSALQPIPICSEPCRMPIHFRQSLDALYSRRHFENLVTVIACHTRIRLTAGNRAARVGNMSLRQKKTPIIATAPQSRSDFYDPQRPSHKYFLSAACSVRRPANVGRPSACRAIHGPPRPPANANPLQRLPAFARLQFI